MNQSAYTGHYTQMRRIEEHRLVGGKGDGMRLLEADNGRGLSFTISADRCGDISRMSYKGINLGFFAPCGYVSPHYYDDRGLGFLKSFTAGFLTTCGLCAVGSPCDDGGEALPLHGTISNTPAENLFFSDDGDKLRIKLSVRDASLFAHKLVLTREYECSTETCELVIRDRVENIGCETTPYMILYHFNFGYPLLSPETVITLPTGDIMPRNSRAAEGLADALKLCEPQTRYEEQCYYHKLTEGFAKLSNRSLGVAVGLSFDLGELPFFTEWKLMQKGEYVLGLEPGNCNPDGRDKMRETGKLKFLAPGETAEQTIKINITEE